MVDVSSSQLWAYDDINTFQATQATLAQSSTQFGETPAAAFCPSCGALTLDVADTEAGREAHVRTCKDSGEPETNGAHSDGEDTDEAAHRGSTEPADKTKRKVMSTDNSSKRSTDIQHIARPGHTAPAHGATASHAASEALQESSGGATDQERVQQWLRDNELEDQAEAFAKANVTPDLLSFLADEDLQQMGVMALGPRRRILAAIQNTCASGACSTMSNRKCSASGSTACSAAGGGAKITNYFQRNAPHPAGKAASTCGSPVRSHLPSWQKMPGLPFLVDRFGKGTEKAACKSWFLTHFHSDHYKGLTAKFKAGVIYCTLITAKLVHLCLKVPWERLRVVQLNAPVMVEGVRVTFVDANHCPGAAMIVFEPPGRAPIVHTGDCRYHVGMQQEQALMAVRGRAMLILDTTYCAAQYDFPPQLQVLQFVLEAVRAEAFNPATLFLFGSYTIGKERLFLEVARILQRKVYVSASKRAVLDALGLPAEYEALLTTDDRARLHAVPLWRVSLKHMARTLKHYRGRYTTIVGFQPTGWSMHSGRGRAPRGRRRQKGTLIVYSVPYSEHSSYQELRQMVDFLQPAKIIPSVNNDGGVKTSRMVESLRGPA
ncbi:DNA cross-link repair 1A protein at C-terminar half [Coccomyxa sp. Obi]|nr:DNA cross-link repair 1A protein at C-terminar half [Coccomyxa sp. Obi]